jgi:hypothetical protein
MKLSFGKKIASLAVVGAVLAGAGTVAWASSNNGSSSNSTTAMVTAASTTTSGTTGKATRKGLSILRRADHGTVEIKVKGTNGAAATWQTFTFDRGKVSAVSATSITVARPDGQSATLAITPTTKFRGVTSWQQVTTAKGAIVVSENGTATQILQKAASTTTPTTAVPSASSGNTPAA